MTEDLIIRSLTALTLEKRSIAAVSFDPHARGGDPLYPSRVTRAYS